MESEQLAAAMRCWESGDLGAAAVLFRQIAATGDPEASHLLACLLEEQGDLDGAEAAHRSVIQSGDPVFGQRSAIAMGMMLIAAREWPAAHRVLMIASDGADFEVAALAETAMVLVLTEMGDAQGATEALERARRCDSPAVAELAAQLELPDFATPDPGTARELYELAQDEDDYRQLLTCGDPDVVSLSAFRLFQMYADEKNFAAAREVCEHAIAVGHPDHLATAHRLLGAVLVDLGEYAEAVDSYATAAEDPRPDERLPALIEQAKVTAQLGDVAATKAIFHRVIASGQREYAVEAQACLAQMHTEAGEVAEALAALRAVLDTGESQWSSICVTLLGLLLDRHPDERESLMALVLDTAEHDDPDAAFKAALLIDHAARQQPLADPVEEQALLDVDEALRHLRAGDLDGARRLLRGAIDSGAAIQSVRAMMTLAELELGEGDREQADELLSYVAEGDDLLQGFSAEFFLHLLRESGDEPHPVLRAVIDHQRLGREEGLVRYRQAMEHPNPATAAIGTAVFAQVLASIGYDLSDAAGLFHAAADSGDPLALSYTATIFKDVLVNQEQTEEALALLRRARADGHPGLAPWVAYALGELLGERAGEDLGGGEGSGAGRRERELVEARAALTEAMETCHRGLRIEAMGALLGLFERQGDLLAACRLHERFVAVGDPLQAPRNAWLLGLTRVRLDDLDGARAAFAHIPETHPEESDTGRYARFLLDRDFGAAAAAFGAIADDGRSWMAAMLAMQSSHAWQRQGDTAAADGALSLVLSVGDPAFRQEAACYLGALRHDNGDPHGAIAAWQQAETGPDERLATIACRNLAQTWHTLGDLDAAARAYRKVLAGCGDAGTSKASQWSAEGHRQSVDGRLGLADGRQGSAAAARAAEADQGMTAAAGKASADQGTMVGADRAQVAVTESGVAAGAGNASADQGAVAGADRAQGAMTESGVAVGAGNASAYQGAVAGADEAQVAVTGSEVAVGAGEASAAGAYQGEEDVVEAAVRLGEILIATGSVEEAREVLRVAFGDAAAPHLARLLRDAGDLEGALAAAETAVRIAPIEWVGEAACLLGGLLARTGDLAGARAAFERAVVADPGLAGAFLVEAGRRLEEAGDHDGARSAYQRAAAQDADRRAAATARVRLGTASPEERPWVLAAEGDRQGALAALTELTGSASMARLLLALDAGELTEVRRLLTGSPSAGRPDPAPAETLEPSTVESSEPSPVEALEPSTAEASGFPTDEAFAEMLEMAGTTRDDAFARALYQLVIQLGGPERVGQARLRLGADLARDGQYSQAELCLLPATESDDAELALIAWRDVSAVRRRRGDLDGAVEALRAAMPATAVELAGLLEEGGDLAGAGDVLDRGAAAGDLASLRHLLVNLLQRREYAAVAAEAELAVGTGDPETVAMGYWVWGDACESTGDLAGAVAMYRKGIDTGHSSAGMRVDLAEALHALGDTAAAAGEARLAIESGEADAVARGGLQLGCWLHEDGDPLGAAEAFAAAAGTWVEPAHEPTREPTREQAREPSHEPTRQLAQAAMNNLSTLAYQAYERGEHALAVQVLSHLGPHAGTKARELAELCDDPDAVHLYYELVGSDAFTELGVAERLAELGETARARAVYERLNEHEDPDVRFVAGGRLLALLDAENDTAAFYRLAEQQAGDADSPVRSVFGSLFGMLQGRQGDTEASLRTLREAAESGEATALSVFAQALVGSGEVAEGREVYRRVLGAGDDELAARAMVALGHSYQEEDEAEARRWYVRAVEFGTGHVSALGAMYLGALAKRERDFPEALGWYQRVIDSGDTESGMAAAHLGELCYWLNDRDGAVRYYELTLGLTEQPDLVAEAAFRLGEIRYAHGDLTVARRMLRLAAGVDDSAFAADAHRLLAKLG